MTTAHVESQMIQVAKAAVNALWVSLADPMLTNGNRLEVLCVRPQNKAQRAIDLAEYRGSLVYHINKLFDEHGGLNRLLITEAVDAANMMGARIVRVDTGFEITLSAGTLLIREHK